MNMDSIIQVDQEKCIRCGICAAVCPVKVIHMGKHGPEDTGNHCIACGHCVAVCPREALNNVKAPLSNQISLEKISAIDEKTAACFLRSRRSVRCYQPKPVPREKLLQLLNIARLAPTGGNSQGISYYVMDQRDTLKKITAATVDWMEEALKADSPSAAYYKATVAHYRNTGQDVILRDAPCLIIALAPKKFMPRGRDNTHFSLAYAELYAPTIGLGTCWAGFFEACALSDYQPLLELLALPANMTVTGGIMAGYPKYTYKRLVDRKPLHVIWQ